jgi:hypothetical protein
MHCRSVELENLDVENIKSMEDEEGINKLIYFKQGIPSGKKGARIGPFALLEREVGMGFFVPRGN